MKKFKCAKERCPLSADDMKKVAEAVLEINEVYEVSNIGVPINQGRIENADLDLKSVLEKVGLQYTGCFFSFCLHGGVSPQFCVVKKKAEKMVKNLRNEIITASLPRN